MVQLEGGRRGRSFALRRAASISLPDELIRPSFEQPNIADRAELVEALNELATAPDCCGNASGQSLCRRPAPVP